MGQNVSYVYNFNPPCSAGWGEKAPDDGNLRTKEELRARLPKVGDVLIRTPELGYNDDRDRNKDLKCTVVMVNEENLWYGVEFKGKSGCYRQCYRVV